MTIGSKVIGLSEMIGTEMEQTAHLWLLALTNLQLRAMLIQMLIVQYVGRLYFFIRTNMVVAFTLMNLARLGQNILAWINLLSASLENRYLAS